MNIETPQPAFQPGMAERAIDTATDVSRTITEISTGLQAAVDRLSLAIATARQPGKPLSTISAITRGSAAREPVRRVPVRRGGGAAARDSQNSFGPRRSSLDSQVIKVATAIISAIPAMLTATCMARVPETWVRITKPTNDSNTLRQ